MHVRDTVEKASIISENTTYHHEQDVGRNTNIKGASGEVSDGNVETVTGPWRKRCLCSKLAKNMVELGPRLSCKVGIVSDEIGYLRRF